MDKKIASFNLLVNLGILIIAGIILYKVSGIQTNEPAGNSPETKNDTSSTNINKIYGVIDTAKARLLIMPYRDENPKTKMIWFDQAEVKTYIDSNFLKYTLMDSLPAGFSWKMAFCPIYYGEGEAKRLSICFMPTIIKGEKDVFDYWECKDEKDTTSDKYKIYQEGYKKLEVLIAKDKLTSFIFDEGHLWP